MIIFCATISHKHGTNFYVDHTEELLQKQIADFVRENWNLECIEGEIPDNDDEAVEQYFEQMADGRGGGEHLAYGEAELPPPPETP
jgi:hypothetical protein